MKPRRTVPQTILSLENTLAGIGPFLDSNPEYRDAVESVLKDASYWLDCYAQELREKLGI